MENFVDGHHIWLRSSVRGWYLHAADDGIGVSLQRHRASLNAAWTVHLAGPRLLLHSAAYGRYLGATADAAPLGHRGRATAQFEFDQPELQAIAWEAVSVGDAVVLLRHATGGYLRANGRYLRWNTGVTVGNFGGAISTMAHWAVEAIPGIPVLQVTPQGFQIADQAQPVIRPFHEHALQVQPVIRPVFFVRAADDGAVDEDAWAVLEMSTVSLVALRDELASPSRVGWDMHFVWKMFVRAGRYGRLTPLVVNLPTSNFAIHIVLLRSGSPVVAALRVPDTDA